MAGESEEYKARIKTVFAECMNNVGDVDQCTEAVKKVRPNDGEGLRVMGLGYEFNDRSAGMRCSAGEFTVKVSPQDMALLEKEQSKIFERKNARFTLDLNGDAPNQDMPDVKLMFSDVYLDKENGTVSITRCDPETNEKIKRAQGANITILRM